MVHTKLVVVVKMTQQHRQPVKGVVDILLPWQATQKTNGAIHLVEVKDSPPKTTPEQWDIFSDEKTHMLLQTESDLLDDGARRAQNISQSLPPSPKTLVRTNESPRRKSTACFCDHKRAKINHFFVFVAHQLLLAVLHHHHSLSPRKHAPPLVQVPKMPRRARPRQVHREE
jgi:hypothetical protein